MTFMNVLFELSDTTSTGNYMAKYVAT